MINKLIVEDALLGKAQLFNRTNENFSKTRDIFSARLQTFIIETEKYLEAAIIGEIGNNTFDHNFGYISDYPDGVYCDNAYKQWYVVLVDYGKGILQSLLNVLPELRNDKEAVEIAFTQRISGRSPEQRGNGLKFVADTIIEKGWCLYFQSGNGSCSIDKNGLSFAEEANFTIGCLAIIDFHGDIKYDHTGN